MKTVFLLFLFSAIVFSCQNSFAQRFFVSGKVLDAITEHPVQQLSVEEVNSKTGTITGRDGQYTLLLKGGDVNVLFRGAGFKDARYNFNLQGDTIIDVSLLPDLTEHNRKMKREIISGKDLTGAMKGSLLQKK